MKEDILIILYIHKLHGEIKPELSAPKHMQVKLLDFKGKEKIPKPSNKKDKKLQGQEN